MTLTTNGKNYIANKFGSNGCFASSGLSWTYLGTDNVTYAETGATAQLVSRLVMTSIVVSVKINSVTYTYAQLKSNNDNTDVSLTDTQWISQNDGFPSTEPRYCVAGQTPTPTPTATPFPTNTPSPTPTTTPGPTPVPGNLGQFNFSTGATGNPTVILDVASVSMKQSATDQHFEINTVKITNTSPFTVYLASEIRLFQGAQSICPTSGHSFRGLDRVSTTKEPRIKTLDPGIAASYNLDFYQPGTITGIHTVCLYVHGSFDKEELEAEIEPITG